MFLRPRKQYCFYCGSRTEFERIKSKASFLCSQCDAVNYLDDNGNITDPPSQILEAQAQELPRRTPRFAQTSFSTSSDSENATGLFCATCLKNQHIVQQSLSNYLPTDPSQNDQLYIKGYESYRSRLEQRYPQVCAECAPRVRQQIRKAGYIAKTDHLRRLTDNTRIHGVTNRSWSQRWRKALLHVAGLCSYASLAAQLSWHISNLLLILHAADGIPQISQYRRKEIFGFDAIEDLLASISQQIGPTNSKLQPYASGTLILAVSTFWWNDKLHSKYFGSGGRLVGLSKYYLLSALVLGVRASAIWFLSDPLALSHLKLNQIQGFHFFMVTFIILAVPLLRSMIQLDAQPPILFQLRDEDILADVGREMSNDDGSSEKHNVRSENPDVLVRTPTNQLSISSLASRRDSSPGTKSLQHKATFSTATGNVESKVDDAEYDSDAMDWAPVTPKQQPFQPRPRAKETFTLTNPSDLTSPFRKSVPSAPSSRMTHPNARPMPKEPAAFVRGTSQQKHNFFSRSGDTPYLSKPKTRTVFGEEIEISDHSDAESDNFGMVQNVSDSNEVQRRYQMRKHETNNVQMTLQPPRFWGTSQMSNGGDTGLENLFDEVFSLTEKAEGGSSTPTGTPKTSHRTKTSSQQYLRNHLSIDRADRNGLDSTLEPRATNNNMYSSVIGILVICIMPLLVLGFARWAATGFRPNESP